jgi:murein DD-endopeptidase MepM/ murein hydrolase activator NlpD
MTNRYYPFLALLVLSLLIGTSTALLMAQTEDELPPDPPPRNWATIELPPHPPLDESNQQPFLTPEDSETVPDREAEFLIADPEPAPEAPAVSTYVVQRGDNLYRIAQRHGVTVAALAAYNNLANPRLIHAGTVLAIPGANSSPPVVVAEPIAAANGTYTVRAGDNLFTIARRHGITLNDLIAANNIREPRRIHPGAVLVIPERGNPAPVRTPATTTETTSNDRYVVQPGDNLSRIARRFQVSVAALAAANTLRSTWLIYPGQELRIPTESTTSVTSVPVLAPIVPLAEPEPAPTPPPEPEVEISDYIWPVESRHIAQYYRAGHRAIDVLMPVGSPVLAMAAGVVEFAGWNIHGYGNLVVLDHGNGVRTLYAHNSSFNVETGQEVEQGDVIALSGNTGRSTAPHLHLEFIVNGRLLNPCNYLPGGC